MAQGIVAVWGECDRKSWRPPQSFSGSAPLQSWSMMIGCRTGWIVSVSFLSAVWSLTLIRRFGLPLLSNLRSTNSSASEKFVLSSHLTVCRFKSFIPKQNFQLFFHFSSIFCSVFSETIFFEKVPPPGFFIETLAAGFGVSGHMNHIAINKALRQRYPEDVDLYELESIPFWRKYIGVVNLLAYAIRSDHDG